MDNRFVALNAMDDQEAAVKLFKEYDRVALPVVSIEGILLGIVTFDDIMDVDELESTEDFHKFGSIQSAIANPMTAKVFDLYKNRVVWLFVLVFMNVFSGAVVPSFRAPEIVLVVGLSMILTVIIGSLIGFLLPFIFTRLKLDPATASAPLVTSLSDICGVVIYFSIASWYFGF